MSCARRQEGQSYPSIRTNRASHTHLTSLPHRASRGRLVRSVVLLRIIGSHPCPAVPTQACRWIARFKWLKASLGRSHLAPHCQTLVSRKQLPINPGFGVVQAAHVRQRLHYTGLGLCNEDEPVPNTEEPNKKRERLVKASQEKNKQSCLTYQTH